jgi:hypothetical protein
MSTVRTTKAPPIGPFAPREEDKMFEISARQDGEEATGNSEVVGNHDIIGVMMSPRYLPRRSAESPFAPAQYYYAASKTGVVPSWRFQ